MSVNKALERLFIYYLFISYFNFIPYPHPLPPHPPPAVVRGGGGVAGEGVEDTPHPQGVAIFMNIKINKKYPACGLRLVATFFFYKR